MRHQCDIVANKANIIMGYIRRTVGNRIGKVIIPLFSVVTKSCLEYCVLFVLLSVHVLFTPSTLILRNCRGSDGDLPKCLRDVEDMVCKEEELHLFSLARRNL